jgi:hypothetical protein
MQVVADGTGAQVVGGLGPLALVVLIGAIIVQLCFQRRIGGKGGGAEKASVPAFWLLGAIVLGLVIATR